MNRELLTRPFDSHQIKQRPGQHGRTVSYVDVAAVIGRLNEACETWSFEVVAHQIHDIEVIVLGKLSADGMTKMAFGGSAITIDKSGEIVSVADDLKAASSDSLKKCASLLGVALELYGGGNGQSQTERRLAPADRVTTRQLAAIQGAARRSGLSKDALTALVMKTAGKSELAELSRSEASDVITALSGGNGR